MNTSTAVTAFTFASVAFIGSAPGVSFSEVLIPMPEVSIMESSYSAPETQSEKPPIQYEFFATASARLLSLKSLDEDHDGEGASAPLEESMNTAIAFVQHLPFYAPDPVVGVNADGMAVVEFHDENEFGQVIFGSDRTAEIYYSVSDSDPTYFEGSLDSPLVAARFLAIFGFQLRA